MLLFKNLLIKSQFGHKVLGLFKHERCLTSDIEFQIKRIFNADYH